MCSSGCVPNPVPVRRAAEWWSCLRASTLPARRFRRYRSRFRSSSPAGSVEQISNVSAQQCGRTTGSVYRFQFGDVPSEVLGHGHHLVDDAVHFLSINTRQPMKWNQCHAHHPVPFFFCSTKMQSASHIDGSERQIKSISVANKKEVAAPECNQRRRTIRIFWKRPVVAG